MPKQMFATIQITLSDDQFQAAEQMIAFKPLWDGLLRDLRAAGENEKDQRVFSTKLEIIETRAKPAAGTGAKRGRKPKSADGAQQPANPAALV